MLAPQDSVVGVVALTGAVLLLLPAAAWRAVLVERLTENVKAGRRSSRGRAALDVAADVGIAATGAVAVFGSVAIQGAHADLRRGLDRSARDVSTAADVWAFPPG